MGAGGWGLDGHVESSDGGDLLLSNPSLSPSAMAATHCQLMHFHIMLQPIPAHIHDGGRFPLTSSLLRQHIHIRFFALSLGQERRLHAMRHAGQGPVYGDEKIGPVDQIQLQREMRRRALLEQMKNSAWAGSFRPEPEEMAALEQLAVMGPAAAGGPADGERPSGGAGGGARGAQ